MRQLEAALPPGVQVASNSTQAGGPHALSPAAEVDNENVEKRSASMLLGCAAYHVQRSRRPDPELGVPSRSIKRML